MFRSNMWALKNKTTGEFLTEGDLLCNPQIDLPMLYGTRTAARDAKRIDQAVVKVSVNIRAAA